MYRVVKWRRLQDPIVYGGVALALLCAIGLAQTLLPPALKIAAGCLVAGVIFATSIGYAKAKRRVELSRRRLQCAQRRMAQGWRRLEAEQRAAHAATQAKSRFFADISHELRTPLGGIACLSRVLLDDETNGDRRRSLATIVSSSEALIVLANDVLDQSRIEAGKLELRPGRFDLRHLLQDLAALSRAAAPGVAIVLDYPQDAPVWFTGDAGRIRQIVANLLGNAVKFTCVRVCVAVRAVAGDVSIAVTDNGPGIPADRLSGIFDPFVQLEASTNGLPGAGLGLPISRRLAELMGGRIDVQSEIGQSETGQSEIGQGSTFTLSVPLAATEPGVALPAPQTAGEKPHGGRTIRVLAAEDNKTNRQILASMLKTQNVELSLAQDGREAVDMFLKSAPDMILMDLGMPHLNGLEATAEIRNLEQAHGLRRTPIVALTANAMRGDRDRCLDANMDDFMSKPLLKTVLLSMLDKWGNRSERADRKPIFEQERRAAGTDRRSIEGRQHDVAPVIDNDRVIALVADLGASNFAEIVTQFDRDMGDALPRLAGCITASNAGEIDRTIHLIRSCAANLGLSRIVQVCDRVRTDMNNDASSFTNVVDELSGEFNQAKTALNDVFSGTAPLRPSRSAAAL